MINTVGVHQVNFGMDVMKYQNEFVRIKYIYIYTFTNNVASYKKMKGNEFKKKPIRGTFLTIFLNEVTMAYSMFDLESNKDNKDLKKINNY